MKNFLCWPLEIIRTVYTKLVDKVFGKRCQCKEILPGASLKFCITCGKVHNG